jgi:glycerophosphoryl diester phosphodiesterase
MNRLFRIVGLLTFVVAVALFYVIGFWRPGLFLAKTNIGHQLGGDIFAHISGNTVEALEAGLSAHESSDQWRYAECDIRETRDHQLIVFHDWDISAVPDSPENRIALGKPVGDQAICDLTCKQLGGLKLKCGNRIPTLEELLQAAATAKPQKPLLLEVKYLHSAQGRQQLLELAKRYRDGSDVEIHFLGFIRNIQRSFPDPKIWLKQCAEAKFRVYQVYRPKTADYDLCKTW